MKTLKIGFAGLIIFLFMVSCSLRPSSLMQSAQTPLIATATPTTTPTPKNTATITLTKRPTFTQIPSSTRGPSITPYPSLSPIPSDDLLAIQNKVTKAPRFLTGGDGPYQCKVLSTRPEELEVLRPKEEFGGKWIIENKGKLPWLPTDVAFFYISGSKFQTAKYRENFIPFIINKTEELSVNVPMRAPAEPGVYYTIWGLRSKSRGQFFCSFAISITVEEKK